jgi:lipopolysaccharide/colanic/teichoic acid biosynthesis glycosyltransferase
MYKSKIKPVLDFLTALIGFLILSPIFIVVMFLLALANKGKAFFVQKRPGKNERIFSIIKFKTMTDAVDQNGNLLPDSERLTSVGKLVRKTSLDELPQLLNVLKGDMSLVGPRPLLPEYLALYNEQQRKRHQVKPGITGWAQVNGRNAISWHDKFKLDVEYVANQSFKLDLKILYLTFKKVVISEGINQDGQATAHKFEGN